MFKNNQSEKIKLGVNSSIAWFKRGISNWCHQLLLWPGVEIFSSYHYLLFLVFKDSSVSKTWWVSLSLNKGLSLWSGRNGVRSKVTQISVILGWTSTGTMLRTVNQWKYVWMMACSHSPSFWSGMVLALWIILVSGSHTSFLFSCSFVQMLCTFWRVAFELNSEVSLPSLFSQEWLVLTF